jgi:arabinogalactan oligomer / maltooligosaccharide transport system permease protein
MSAQAPEKIKADRMPFGRWMRLLGWRHAITLVFVAWALFPAFYVVSLALAGGNTLTSACPPSYQGLEAIRCIFPTSFTTTNYEAILNNPTYPFWTWFLNTTVIAFLGAAGSLFMGAAAAFAFSRLRFTGRRPGLLALMLVQMFPAVLALTAIYTLLREIRDVFPAIGLGSIWGLMLVYLGGALGVNTFLMKGFFDTIPVDIDESARIDGAGHARIFFGLILRLATPVLTVVFFTAFAGTFNELAIAQVILPNIQNTTLAVGMYALVSNPLDQEWGMFAAGSTIAAIPLFVLFLFTQKSLVTGLTAGAVKG